MRRNVISISQHERYAEPSEELGGEILENYERQLLPRDWWEDYYVGEIMVCAVVCCALIAIWEVFVA